MRDSVARSRFVLFFAALVTLCCFTMVPLAAADDYDVTATVPAPLPSEPPVITSTPNNTTVSSPTVEITGTCTVEDPPLIVELIRDGQVIGSTVCQPDGTFRITITLVKGVNKIYPRFRTITGDYGGEGLPIILTYETPSSVGGPPAQSNIDPLKISRLETFIVFTPGKDVPLQFSVSGGTPPYSLLIDWGDNVVSKLNIDAAGNITATHAYKKAQFYTIRIRLTDTRKQLSILDIAAVTYAKPSGLSAPQSVLTAYNNQLWKLYVLLGLMVIVTWVAAYRIGLRKAGVRTGKRPAKGRQAAGPKRRK